ncbi:MAG: hypothetical protein PVH31_05375 [Ectothiorhodospiraceae bacterium]|jgi:hypothetical protein
MNRGLLRVLVSLALLIPALAVGGGKLPASVPAGAPFPDGVDVDVKTGEMSGAERVTASFTFFADAAPVYEDFKRYAVENGYHIATEDRDGYRFSSTDNAANGLVVDISDMGAVKVGTVTFMIPQR